MVRSVEIALSNFEFTSGIAERRKRSASCGFDVFAVSPRVVRGLAAAARPC